MKTQPKIKLGMLFFVLLSFLLFSCKKEGKQNRDLAVPTEEILSSPKTTTEKENLSEQPETGSEKQEKTEEKSQDHSQSIPDEVGDAGDPFYYEIYINRDEEDEQRFVGQFENKTKFKEDIERSYAEYHEQREVVYLNVENDEIALQGHFIEKTGRVYVPFENNPEGDDNSYLKVTFKNLPNAAFESISGRFSLPEYSSSWGAEVEGKELHKVEYKLQFGGLYKDAGSGNEKIISGTLIVNSPPQ